MGQRRMRRLQRARHHRVGIAVVATVAVLAGAITIFASTIDKGEAGASGRAEAAAAVPARHQQPQAAARPATLLAHTVVKSVLDTKDRVNPYPPPGAGDSRTPEPPCREREVLQPRGVVCAQRRC